MLPLAHLIRHEIAERGPIPFNRFMELALYCPECGFYEKEGDNVGRRGDFYTSVSVGPLFGELLAFRFADWLEELRIADCGLRIVEAGAHDGRLAADILDWFKRQQPELSAKLEYCLLEPSSRRREWQQKTLARFSRQVRWLGSLDPSQPAAGNPQFTIIFSNELLDAMPVRRFGWDATEHDWFEWGVATEGERFLWTRLSSAAGAVAGLPTAPELLDVLPDGYTTEMCPAAEAWWQGAARWLQCGKLLTFDYGFDAANQIQPARVNGTLRAYRNHKLADDILAAPGDQDLTAHVNFSRVESIGTAAGLKTDTFESQGKFLTSIAAEAWKPGSRFGDWDPKRTRQFQTLTHPEHLGRSFRVLVQSRDCNS